MDLHGQEDQVREVLQGGAPEGGEVLQDGAPEGVAWFHLAALVFSLGVVLGGLGSVLRILVS
jgi:hypothetical protein